MARKRRQPRVDSKRRAYLAYFSTSRTESILISSNTMPAESTDLDLEKHSRSDCCDAIRWNVVLLDNNMCRDKNLNHPLPVLPNTTDTKSEKPISMHRHRRHIAK